MKKGWLFFVIPLLTLAFMIRLSFGDSNVYNPGHGGGGIATYPSTNGVVFYNGGSVWGTSLNVTALTAWLGFGNSTGYNVGTGANQIPLRGAGGNLTANLTVALVSQYIDWNSVAGGNSIANKPTLGTASANATGDFLAAGGKALSANTADNATHSNTTDTATVANTALVANAVAVANLSVVANTATIANTAVIANTALVANSLSAGASNAFQPANSNLTEFANIIPSTFMLTFLDASTAVDALDSLASWGISGVITDEQLVCAETTGGHNLLKTCGAKLTDSSSNSTYLYKDSTGAIVSTTLGDMLKDTAGNLSVREVANFNFFATNVAATTGNLTKPMVVSNAMNGYSVESVTCGVYGASANAGNTIINLIRRRAGSNTTVFTTGANIGANVYGVTAVDIVNATVALVATNDLLIPQVTEVSTANAPTGLTCSFVFAH